MKIEFEQTLFSFGFQHVMHLDILDATAQMEQFWTNVMSCCLHSGAAVYPPLPPFFFTRLSEGV